MGIPYKLRHACRRSTSSADTSGSGSPSVPSASSTRSSSSAVPLTPRLISRSAERAQPLPAQLRTTHVFKSALANAHMQCVQEPCTSPSALIPRSLSSIVDLSEVDPDSGLSPTSTSTSSTSSSTRRVIPTTTVGPAEVNLAMTSPLLRAFQKTGRLNR